MHIRQNLGMPETSCSTVVFITIALVLAAQLIFNDDTPSKKQLPEANLGSQIPLSHGKTVLMCLVGGLRTYALEQAHKTIHEHVYMALGGPKNVDVGVVVSYLLDADSRGAKNGNTAVCYDNWNISRAFNSLQPKSVQILEASTCTEYKKVWNASHCDNSKGHANGTFAQMF